MIYYRLIVLRMRNVQMHSFLKIQVYLRVWALLLTKGISFEIQKNMNQPYKPSL